MKVVFLEDVAGVALGGDVKEVKNGFARNYLIPKRLATPLTGEALKRVERLKREAEATRIKTLADMKALGEAMEGAQVNVEMRAGASGRLYGSVTNAIVAEQLSKTTGREIDRRTIEIRESIREVGLFDVRLRLHADVEADVKLLVHPMGTDPGEFLASLEAAREPEAEKEAAEAVADQPAEAVAIAEEEAPEAAAEPPTDGGDVAQETPADADEQPGGAVAVAEEEVAEAIAEAPPKDVAVVDEKVPEAVVEAPPEDVAVVEQEKTEDGETREDA